VFPIKDEVKTVNKDGIGIPHVIFETTAPGESQKEKLFSMTTLPTPQEVVFGIIKLIVALVGVWKSI
jgi:hypothetical protein